MHEAGRLRAELRHHGLGLQGIMEVLNNEVLGVSRAQSPKVDEQAVPAALLFVAVLERFEGEKGSLIHSRVRMFLLGSDLSHQKVLGVLDSCDKPRNSKCSMNQVAIARKR